MKVIRTLHAARRALATPPPHDHGSSHERERNR